MKPKTLLFTILLVAFSSAMQAQVLNPYRWSHRVILLFSPTEGGAYYQKQLAIFKQETAAMEERDLVVFHVYGTTGKHPSGRMLEPAEVAALRTQFKTQQESFYFILVGKDGGEKLRKTALVQPEELYRLIDAMPMRRHEMRTRGY